MDYDNITEIDFISKGKINILLRGMRILVRLEDDDSKLYELEHHKKYIIIKDTGKKHEFSYKNKYFYFDDEYKEEKINEVLKGSNESKIGNVLSMRDYSEAELNARMSAANIKASDHTSYKISVSGDLKRQINNIILDL